jgi:hypothetical protein
MSPDALQKKPVGHDIVQGTVDYAAVSHVLVSDMVFTGTETGSTNALIHMKLNLQADRVGWPANETIIGIRSPTIISHHRSP